MEFSDPNLLAAIKMCRGSKLSSYRAVGYNFFWDRRIGAERAASFEKSLSLPVVDSEEEFCEAVRRYHKSHVEWNVEEQPCEFFQSANDCVGSEYLPTERTVLVRMVDIKFALKKSGLTLEQLKNALPLHHGAAANEASDNIACARSFLKKFVKTWNDYKQRPPAFAGFADDVEVELGKPDWSDQLRRRFGLGQMRVPARGTSIPVMLLRYSVADVLNAAKKHGVTATAIRVPRHQSRISSVPPEVPSPASEHASPPDAPALSKLHRAGRFVPTGDQVC